MSDISSEIRYNQAYTEKLPQKNVHIIFSEIYQKYTKTQKHHDFCRSTPRETPGVNVLIINCVSLEEKAHLGRHLVSTFSLLTASPLRRNHT